MAQLSLRKPCFEDTRKSVIRCPLQSLTRKADRVVRTRSMGDGQVHCYMPISGHDVIRPAMHTAHIQRFTYYCILFGLLHLLDFFKTNSLEF